MILNRNQDFLLNFVRKLEIDTTVSDSYNLSSEIWEFQLRMNTVQKGAMPAIVKTVAGWTPLSLYNWIIDRNQDLLTFVKFCE
jgi:hypothetical protein